MSNYNTGNPVPSIDPRDLDDNATVFDLLLQSSAASVPDRQGAQRKTWHQMELDAAALISPNVSALAALTAAADKGVFFSASGPVTMGTYTLTAFTRSLGTSVDQAAFRTAIAGAKSGANTDITSITGSAASLTTSRTLSATGDATWSVSFNGTANVTAALTLAASGVGAGTYGSVTVNAKGLVTAASVATPIANGGTGQTTQGAALTALLGASIVPIANGGTGSAATAMANLTLQNSWTLSAGGRAAYRKVVDFVYLELRITAGTATDGTVLATLPVGFRPASQVVMPCASPPNTALSTTIAGPRIVINTDGTITCANCTNVVIQALCTFSLT